MVREPFNALSHALGVPLALLGTALLLLLAPKEAWPALLTFGLTMALTFGASALYHALRVGEKTLAWLRRLDHAAIFLFIAGSYTPFLAEGLSQGLRPFALGLVWGLALLGVGFRLFFLKAPRWLYTLAYLGLGWLSVLFLPRLELPFPTFVLMAASGVFYTLGALVYGKKRPDPWPGRVGFHGLWHLLVLLGSFLMYLAVLSLYT
ncbi:MAG: hemolysin III family protein [Thermus sp.]|uniref:PAQR family membrane homeostasis protein TrhA n=1 Tax=Thermus sp. TaxID=275 RepID=UPI0025F5B8C0|nr:hemolysin III family protein [Thermus sp.]MCS6868856.1 hemolysin III family protein [Thermus sp.]MCS7218410.1 hemolysin III family protein [Thermus sp.]MDW8016835.1 hemolysin III family protein [Thermus sp.]MDW8356986.1 hemolysin III family protein [Thermus sp.]